MKILHDYRFYVWNLDGLCFATNTHPTEAITEGFWDVSATYSIVNEYLFLLDGVMLDMENEEDRRLLDGLLNL